MNCKTQEIEMQVVIVNKAMYRGESVEGTFTLVQGFTPFQGDVTKRRNGRAGEGFIKVRPEGEQMTRLAPNLDRPVKLTVVGDGMGYTVQVEGLPAGRDGCGAVALFETFTPEFGVDAEREMATAGVLVAQIESLRAEFEAAKGRERDALRKRLHRMEAKLA